MAAANTLADTIETDFLACSICFEQLTDPVGLPCLHGFCFECLDNWHKSCKDKTQVVCPACKQTARVPRDCVRGFHNHFLVNNLREALDVEKKVEKQTCKLCGKSVSVHCFNRKNNLCSECHESDDAVEFMKDHAVVTNLDEFEWSIDMHEIRFHFCKFHGEQVSHYCETENKTVCRTCISLRCKAEHKCVSINDHTATKQRLQLEKCSNKCVEALMKTGMGISSTKQTKQNLGIAQSAALDKLEKMEAHCYQQIDNVHDVIDKYRKEINAITKDKELKLKGTLDNFKKHFKELELSKYDACELIDSGSDFLISYRYTSMSEKLQSLCEQKQQEIDQSLGYVNFEVVSPMSLPVVKVLKQEHWELVEKVELDLPQVGRLCIRINIDNGDMCISDHGGHIKLYSRKGLLKHTFLKSNTGHGTRRGVLYRSFAITPDSRYIIYDDKNDMIHFDSKGRHLSSNHGIESISFIQALSSDENGRIILAGSDYDDEGGHIAIHYSEGSLMSKFKTRSKPIDVSTCGGNKIVASFLDESLRIMDYSGRYVTTIQKPPNCHEWDPRGVCCSSDEIFVINYGYHRHIYKFDPQNGRYLGIVATDVTLATGMALSKDGNSLFVVGSNSNAVNIYKRP